MIKYDRNSKSRHKRIVMEFFGFAPEELIPCELCILKNESDPSHNINRSDDVHHAEARGMGGDPSGSKDVIENLACVCRSCHNELESDPELNATFIAYLGLTQIRKKKFEEMMYD